MYKRTLQGMKKNPYRGRISQQRREQARMDAHAPDYPLPFKKLRRMLIAVDFDFTPFAVIIYCGQSNRCDSYRLTKGSIQDPDLIKILERIGELTNPVTTIPGRNGWSRAVELIRKSFLRVRAL